MTASLERAGSSRLGPSTNPNPGPNRRSYNYPLRATEQQNKDFGTLRIRLFAQELEALSDGKHKAPTEVHFKSMSLSEMTATWAALARQIDRVKSIILEDLLHGISQQGSPWLVLAGDSNTRLLFLELDARIHKYGVFSSPSTLTLIRDDLSRRKIEKREPDARTVAQSRAPRSRREQIREAGILV